MNTKEQMKIIQRGTAAIFPEEELLEKLKEKRPLRIKLGIDPTAGDIHLGFTVVLRKLRQFQDLGHKAVLIIGDYTARVGDPSGRDKTRPQLTEDEIRSHAESYLSQIDRIIDVGNAEVVYNGSWFKDMRFMDVIRLASKMTVAQMLERDEFSKRYQSQIPISLHEFIYPLMQGWDSVEVKADVELGGTDQTFNLTVGRDMQRDNGQAPQVCLTMPLLVGLDGTQKMSKSYGNYIGIEQPANEMYGKAMSIPDELMRNYYELLTDLPMDEINTLLSDATHPRDAKARLAGEIVTMYHGADAAAGAAKEFDRIFAEGKTPENVPAATVPAEAIKDGKVWIVKLITACGFASSNSEARRLVSQGGVTIDDEKITDPNTDVEIGTGKILQVGKRNFARL